MKFQFLLQREHSPCPLQNPLGQFYLGIQLLIAVITRNMHVYMCCMGKLQSILTEYHIVTSSFVFYCLISLIQGNVYFPER